MRRSLPRALHDIPTALPRVPLLVVLTVILLGPALLPAVSGTYVEPGKFRYVRLEEETGAFAADFHPNGSTALIVGGAFGNYRSHRYISLYDGADHGMLLNDPDTRKGPFMDVEWAPNGNLALILGAGSRYHGSIVQCEAPCTSTQHMVELWQPGPHNPYCSGSQCGFEGRQIAWHPNSTHAFLTGNGLLVWTGQQFHLVDPGVETFYDNVAFHPSGDYALIQKDLNALALCETPCLNKTDLQVQTFFFGKYNGSAAIEDITFSKDGSRVFISGMNHQKGLILEISGVNSTDTSTWSRRYLEPQSVDEPNSTKYGEITDLAWHPTQDWALLGSSIERQVMTMGTQDNGTTWNFTTLLDMREPKMQEVEWHPSGSYAIFPAQSGFFRYDPFGMPTVTITNPSSASRATGPVTFEGTATPKDDNLTLTRIEVRVGEEGVWRTIDDANWTLHDDGTATWSTEADPRDAGPGHKGVYVRARDDVIVGPPDVVAFCVDYDGNMHARLQERNETSALVAWSDLAARYGFNASELRYELQVSPDEAFLDNVTTVYEGANPNATVNQTPEDGPLHYRVRATTCGATTTAWSAPVTVDLSTPPPSDDGSGGNDDGSSSSGDADGDDGSSGSGDDGIFDTDPYNDTVGNSGNEDGSSGSGDDGGDSGSSSGEDGGPHVLQGGDRGIPGPGALLALLALAIGRSIGGRRRT